MNFMPGNIDIFRNIFGRSLICILTGTVLFLNIQCKKYPVHENYKLIEKLEGILSVQSGIPGTDYSGVNIRSTEIRDRLPANISWLDTTWNWSDVDFSKYRGGIVEAVLVQAKKPGCIQCSD